MLVNQAIQEFISEKEYENLSKSTLASYSHLFSIFEDWCEKHQYKQIQEINTREIKSFLLMCKTERNNNATSLNNKRKLLRAFFNFLISEKILEENPTNGIRKAKEDIHIKVFSDQEVNEIVSHLRRKKKREKNFYSVRNYCMFLTLIGTGVRASELVSITWNSLDIPNKRLKIYGKARKDQYVPLTEELIKELLYWKAYCEKKFRNLSSSVFVNSQNKALTVNGLKCWFKRLAQTMAFPETRCSPHSCRHYFAKTWIQNGGDISTLSKMLRHTSVKTTEKYLHWFGNEVAEDNNKFNPLNKLSL
ncbi:tyrosine-type recombinase/integrase [Bacillus gobiensis]|uniref:tyrosine-type recombinase/integrase n=1 Tax=Bacillus gobiensis TaxID=1441095 RepID=UPI003D198AC2